MAAQYRKAEKPKIIGYFPTKTYGQDGDTVIVKMRGKGVFFCVKAAGLWYAQTTMQPLSKIDTAYIKDLQSDKLTLKRIENAGINTDKFVVLKDNSIKYRTGDNILNDLDLVKVNYKAAYCSLGQYSSKQSCEANGGTWYYSENDSHDSISSTPENQLLTTGQEIGIMDSEPTLLYDGSTLEIKYNSDYDDNWQTSAQTELLKLSYDSDNYAAISVSLNGETKITTFDDDGTTGHLILQPDGDLKLTPSTGIMYLYDNDNAVDYAKFTVGTNGDLTLETVDANASAANLTLDVDGNIELNADGGNVTFEDGLATKIGFDLANNRYNFFYDGTNFFRITVGGNGVTSLTTTDADGTAGHLTFTPNGDLTLDPASQKTIIKATDGLYFDGGTHTYISESSDDVLDIYVGTDKMLSLDEANDKISLAATNWVAGTVSGATVTEFSSANSAYAGMILGYSVFRNATGSIGNDSIAIDTTMTVLETAQGNKLNVSFVAPPSGKVEIIFSAMLYGSSREVMFSLSDNATYNEVAAIQTYDSLGVKPDETDYVSLYLPFVVQGLTAGTSYQYWIAGDASVASSYLYHGVDRGGSLNTQPITFKVIALPATIVSEE